MSGAEYKYKNTSLSQVNSMLSKYMSSMKQNHAKTTQRQQKARRETRRRNANMHHATAGNGSGMINYITDLHRDIGTDFRRHERSRDRLKTGLDFNAQRLNARMWQMKQDRINRKNIENAGDLQSHLSSLGILSYKGRPAVYGKKKNTYYEDLEDEKTGESILGGPPEEDHRNHAVDNHDHKNNWFVKDDAKRTDRFALSKEEEARLADLRAQVEADMQAAEQAKLGHRVARIDHTPKTKPMSVRKRGSIHPNQFQVVQSTRAGDGPFTRQTHSTRKKLPRSSVFSSDRKRGDSVFTFTPHRTGSMFEKSTRNKAYSIVLGQGNDEENAKRGQGAFIVGVGRDVTRTLLSDHTVLKGHVEKLAEQEFPDDWIPATEPLEGLGEIDDEMRSDDDIKQKKKSRDPSPRKEVFVVDGIDKQDYVMFATPEHGGKNFNMAYKSSTWKKKQEKPRTPNSRHSSRPVSPSKLMLSKRVPDNRKVHDLAPIMTPKELASLFKNNPNTHLHSLMDTD